MPSSPKQCARARLPSSSISGGSPVTTEIGFFAHAVAESNQDLKALIGVAQAFAGPGFLLPTRNHDLLNWCLDHRLDLLMQMTLLTIGLYNEPSGAYLPSILY